MAVAAVAVVLSWPDKQPAEAPCQGAERKLQGIWDDDVRTKVQQAFDSTQRPYAADAFATSERFLDEYTERWVALHTEACEATSVRKEQSQELLDRQMICLGRRLKGVAALTQLLAEADADTVTRAVSATTALDQLAPCMDPEFVMSGAAPLSGDAKEQAARIDDRIASATQLVALGRYEEALAAAEESRQAAIQLDEPSRLAETTQLTGWAQLKHGDAKTAEETLLEAVWLADAASSDAVRAKAWTALVWSVGYQQARHEEVDVLRRHALAALSRSGGNPQLEANLHENLAGIARRRNDPKSAIAELTRALEIRREQRGSDSPSVADALTNLAQAQADVGEFDAAERDLEAAMKIFAAKFGRTHPKVAYVLHARGFVAYRRGSYERAAALFRDAIRVREEALPPDHPALASAVHDLGEVLFSAQDHANALPQFLRAAKLRRARLGKAHESIANSLTGAGRSLAGLGRDEEAATQLEEALTMHDELGTKGLWRAETESALARVLAESDPTRARKLALSARGQYSALGKPDEAHKLDALLGTLAP